MTTFLILHVDACGGKVKKKINKKKNKCQKCRFNKISKMSLENLLPKIGYTNKNSYSQVILRIFRVRVKII